MKDADQVTNETSFHKINIHLHIYGCAYILSLLIIKRTFRFHCVVAQIYKCEVKYNIPTIPTLIYVHISSVIFYIICIKNNTLSFLYSDFTGTGTNKCFQARQSVPNKKQCFQYWQSISLGLWEYIGSTLRFLSQILLHLQPRE